MGKLKLPLIGVLASLAFVGALSISRAIAARPSGEPISIGMIPLLSDPHNYDGKVIHTWGFLCLNPKYKEDDAIFLHKEDCEVPLLKNAFRLELTEGQREQFLKLNLTYVMVDGTLKSEGPASSDLYSGTVTHITLINGWKPYVNLKP